MNRFINRLKLVFIGVFAVAGALIWTYHLVWVWPGQRCEARGGWWDWQTLVCATPVPLSMFTGRQGVGLKLVDELGNETTARAWLAKEKKVPANTPVRDYSLEPRFSELSFLHVAALAFRAVGLSAVAQNLQQWGGVQAIERLNLDGLLALWHPPSSN